MPVGGSDFSHRSQKLQDIAKLAGSVKEGFDSRLVISGGQFAWGSTTAWFRASYNREAQLHFKKILSANYGKEIADHVAQKLGLKEAYLQGLHLSADNVMKALAYAEECVAQSDESYWSQFEGVDVGDPKFAKAIERWISLRVGEMSDVSEAAVQQVIVEVMKGDDLQAILGASGNVDKALLSETLLPLLYNEVERAAAEVLPGMGGNIDALYGRSCAEEEVKTALVHYLALQCGIPASLAQKALEHPGFAQAVGRGDFLNEEHVELLLGHAGQLAKRMSADMVDQSKQKMLAASSSSKVLIIDDLQIDDQAGRPYSSNTQKAIEDGVAYGLCAYNRPDYYVETSGVCYDDQGITQIGDKYVYVRDKRKGVEPGFEARKRFTEKDFQKVFHEPGHKFYQEADAFLLAEISREGSRSRELVLKAQLQGEIPYPRDYIDVQLKDQDSNVSRHVEALRKNNKLPMKDDGTTVDTGKLKGMLFEKFREEANAWADAQAIPLLRSDQDIQAEIIEHVTETFPKFTKLHFVKLDYKESDMTSSQLVRVPVEKSKGIIHRTFTAQTRREANESAAQEAIANDLLRLLGVFSQKLKIIPSHYSDGTPKLLLDGTFMKGPNGENFEDFSGCIVDGYLVARGDAERVKNEQLVPGERVETDQSIEDLGKFLIFMLGLADRDAIGSRGDNKGRCGNTFAGIDPGHSLEVGDDTLISTNLMTFKNVHSDFSFDQPSKLKDKLSKGYKNFDVFQDRPYLEKMKGIESWIALRDSGEDIALFDAYLEVFNGVGEDGKYHAELDFREKITAMKEAYIARRDYILDEVFGDRAPFLAEDHEPYGRPALKMVDALEKLTSVTSMTSPSGVVQLQHPRVISRVQWDMSESDGNVVFTTKQSAGASVALRDFLVDKSLPEGVQILREGASLKVVVPRDKVVEFSGLLNEEAVIQHKHSPDVLAGPFADEPLGLRGRESID